MLSANNGLIQPEWVRLINDSQYDTGLHFPTDHPLTYAKVPEFSLLCSCPAKGWVESALFILEKQMLTHYDDSERVAITVSREHPEVMLTVSGGVT